MKAGQAYIRAVLAAVAALALLVPALASAEATAGLGGSDAPPGITVTGIGFARPGPVARSGGEARMRATDVAHSTAVTRAVGDARRRAKAIAEVLGVRAGAPLAVELRDIGDFARTAPCPTGKGKDSPRCRQADLVAAAASVTFPIVGGSDGSSAAGAVVAHGTASEAVQPTDPKRNRSVKRAVLLARQEATSQGAAAARRNARTAAQSAGLQLGAVVSVSESAAPLLQVLLGVRFRDPALGSFGPGRFCGISSRPSIKLNPKTGEPRIVRRRRYRCRVPSNYKVALEIRYDAG
jgi:hypothetical protein